MNPEPEDFPSVSLKFTHAAFGFKDPLNYIYRWDF